MQGQQQPPPQPLSGQKRRAHPTQPPRSVKVIAVEPPAQQPPAQQQPAQQQGQGGGKRRKLTRKNRKISRKNRKATRKQSGGDCGCMKGLMSGGGDACPKGGNHNWVRINPRNMGGWCRCSKCGAKEAGKC